MYGFAYQGKAKLCFNSHWQATKSLVLLARAQQNYDLTYIGKPLNLWFCMPGHGQTMILLTLASYKIYGFVARASQNFEFTYIGKLPNLWFCSPRHSKTMILRTSTSYQIYGFACQGKAKLWFYSHWQATKSMVLLARALKNYEFIHWQATESMVLFARASRTLASYQIYGLAFQGRAKLWFSHIGKLPNLWCCLLGNRKTTILFTLAS